MNIRVRRAIPFEEVDTATLRQGDYSGNSPAWSFEKFIFHKVGILPRETDVSIWTKEFFTAVTEEVRFV